MSRRRSRSRTRGRARWRSLTVGFIVVVLVVGTVGPPTVAFDAGTADRSTSIGVVDDLYGAQGLNVTSELQEGTEGCLVEVTNDLGQDVTVTVSLRDDSTSYGTLKASLVDEVASGDTVRFDLASGDTQTVNMDVNSGTAGNTTYFHVNASGTGIYAETNNRSAPIVSSAGATCA